MNILGRFHAGLTDMLLAAKTRVDILSGIPLRRSESEMDWRLFCLNQGISQYHFG